MELRVGLQDTLVDRVAGFLSNIGLTVEPRPNQHGFCDGTRIVDGKLYFDETCSASDLLHEAGHLAIVPNIFRHRLNDYLTASMRSIFEELDEANLHPDHPLLRAVIQSGDTEATAWAWAAGCAIGLPPCDIIRDKDYDGAGASLRSWLSSLSYVGIHGLYHAGMCLMPRHGGYPTMVKWLQDASFDTPWRHSEFFEV